MSSTITQTLPPQTTYSTTLHLKPLDYNESRDRLVEILEKYASWTDPFSQRLYRWGTEVLPINLPPDYKPTLEELVYGAQKIEELRRRILISPLDQAPLKEPVLERQWLWERWQLEDFQTLFNRSPFDNQPFEQAVRHRFAEELIDWVQSLEEEEPSSSTELMEMPSSQLDRALLTRSASEEDKALKLGFYLILAQNARLQANMREGIRYPILKASEVHVQLLRETKELIRLERALTIAKEEARAAMLKSQLAQLNETQSHERAILQAQIEDINQRLEGAQGRAQKAELTCMQHEQRIAQLQAAYNQKAQEVENARHDARCAGARNNCEIL